MLGRSLVSKSARAGFRVNLTAVSATPQRRGADTSDTGISADGPGAPGRNFGEEGGRLTYGAYLRSSTLLDQRVLESELPARDELLFVTIHQVYELWFKLLLHELGEIRRAMFDDEVWLARHLFRRVHAVERVLIDQIQVQVQETMTPQDFLAFREKLAPPSGFQSCSSARWSSCPGPRTPASSSGSAARRHRLRWHRLRWHRL